MHIDHLTFPHPAPYDSSLALPCLGLRAGLLLASLGGVAGAASGPKSVPLQGADERLGQLLGLHMELEVLEKLSGVLQVRLPSW